MTQSEAIKQAAIDIWLSMRKYNGRPDQVKFEGFL